MNSSHLNHIYNRFRIGVFTSLTHRPKTSTGARNLVSESVSKDVKKTASLLNKNYKIELQKTSEWDFRSVKAKPILKIIEKMILKPKTIKNKEVNVIVTTNYQNPKMAATVSRCNKEALDPEQFLAKFLGPQDPPGFKIETVDYYNQLKSSYMRYPVNKVDPDMFLSETAAKKKQISKTPVKELKTDNKPIQFDKIWKREYNKIDTNIFLYKKTNRPITIGGKGFAHFKSLKVGKYKHANDIYRLSCSYPKHQKVETRKISKYSPNRSEALTKPSTKNSLKIKEKNPSDKTIDTEINDEATNIVRAKPDIKINKTQENYAKTNVNFFDKGPMVTQMNIEKVEDRIQKVKEKFFTKLHEQENKIKPNQIIEKPNEPEDRNTDVKNKPPRPPEKYTDNMQILITDTQGKENGVNKTVIKIPENQHKDGAKRKTQKTKENENSTEKLPKPATNNQRKPPEKNIDSSQTSYTTQNKCKENSVNKPESGLLKNQNTQHKFARNKHMNPTTVENQLHCEASTAKTKQTKDVKLESNYSQAEKKVCCDNLHKVSKKTNRNQHNEKCYDNYCLNCNNIKIVTKNIEVNNLLSGRKPICSCINNGDKIIRKPEDKEFPAKRACGQENFSKKALESKVPTATNVVKSIEKNLNSTKHYTTAKSYDSNKQGGLKTSMAYNSSGKALRMSNSKPATWSEDAWSNIKNWFPKLEPKF